MQTYTKDLLVVLFGFLEDDSLVKWIKITLSVMWFLCTPCISEWTYVILGNFLLLSQICLINKVACVLTIEFQTCDQLYYVKFWFELEVLIFSLTRFWVGKSHSSVEFDWHHLYHSMLLVCVLSYVQGDFSCGLLLELVGLAGELIRPS